KGRRPPIVLSALVLALAISAMHYTAMAGTTYSALVFQGTGTAPALSPGMLAILVSCVAFLVSGLFLLALVPSKKSLTQPTENTTGTPSLREPPLSEPALYERDATPNKGIETGSVNRPASGLQSASSTARASANTTNQTLPIESDGHRSQIRATDVVAIHADAHYTRLYDGHREFFCPLSISEAEHQLDPKLFSRVHRSHIVNLSRVVSLRRAGDGGLLVLGGEDTATVPVSRARWRRVRTRLTVRLEKADLKNQPDAAQ
ncbi:LytTR family transcriptional regulator DNA-binding domain-containing protein, partial [Roseibium sp. RKSG952]|uniref:LytTR family transcriptional regulator DNA-binding domain-containing protein n=1 Tax=Roseibium sp. RKSG952 TaxID=2529384 RepID=UPI0013CC40F8